MSLKPSKSFVQVLGLLAIFAATPATLFLFYRQGGLPSATEVAFQHNLRYALMNGRDTLDVAPLTTWPWLRVCAVTNGLTEAEFDRVVGFPYRNFEELHWLPRPEYWTLLFIEAPRRPKWGSATVIDVVSVRISRTEVADFSLPPGKKGVCVDRDEAKFSVARNPRAPLGVSPATVALTAAAPASAPQ